MRTTMTKQLTTAAVLSLVAWLTAGCASQLRPYSDAERAIIAEYDAAAARVLARGGYNWKPPIVRVTSDLNLMVAGHPAAYFSEAVAIVDVGRPGTIFINRDILQVPLGARAVLAHELAHYMAGHTRNPLCKTTPHRCEVEAHVRSVPLLVIGWQMEQREALTLVYNYLRGTTKSYAQGTTTLAKGHASPCQEWRDVAAAYSLATPECQP